jgi:transcriptional regulator with GAF, ATPase, and Fis domain
MSKNSQTQYATSLQKLSFNQTATFPRNQRNNIIAEIREINNERNPYQFKQASEKNGNVTVTRIVPTNLYDRSLYIDSINKTQLHSALRSNNWSKEAAAREFGISARSIGRMINKHNIAAKPYNPNAAKTSNKSASSKASSSKSQKTSKNSKVSKTR